MALGEPNKLTEKIMERSIYENLDSYIGGYQKKRRQCPPTLPFLKDIDKSYGFGDKNRETYIKFKRADIIAVDKDVLKIVEVKKYKDSWRSHCEAIIQLMEYNRLAICNGGWPWDKIQLYLISNEIKKEAKELIDFYQIPINIIKFK